MCLQPQKASIILPIAEGMGLLLALSLVCLLSSAKGKTVVTRLPGFNGTLPFELETGYVAADDSKEVNIFYYFFKSERSPSSDPLVLWNIGGPGCTGLSAMDQISPLALEDVEDFQFGNLPAASYRQGSFSSISNIIFVDSPAGAGFSYSTGDVQNEWADTRASAHLNVFLRKWLLDHPEFISNDFYVAGDSYGGKMTPLVAYEVIKGNEAGQVPRVNLKGYIVGNPVTGDVYYDQGTKVMFSHGMGLISHELFSAAEESCKGDYVSSLNGTCIQCIDKVKRTLAELNSEHILVPRCDLGLANYGFSSERGRRSLEDKGNTFIHRHASKHEGCADYKFLPIKFWAENNDVQDALGVHKNMSGDIIRCPAYLKTAYKHDIPSSIPYHLNVTSKGFRALVYSGDHDTEMNFIGTQAWIKSFNFSIVDEWRSWLVNGQVAGYTRTFANNMTFATVKGAGHIAISTNLKECIALIERWIRGRSL